MCMPFASGAIRAKYLSWSACALVVACLFAPAAPAATYTWTNGSGTRTWDTTLLNWTQGTGNVAWVDSNDAVFGSTGVGTVTVAGTQTITSATFNATGYTITGGQLTLGSATTAIAVPTSTDTVTIASVLGGSNRLAKTGAGSLTLSASNSYSGGTTLTAGTLIVGNTNALGATTGRLAVDGGTLNLNGYSVSVGVLSGSANATITTSAVTGTSTLATQVGSGNITTYAGVITDNGAGVVALSKGGAGRLTLSASNSFSGGSSFVGNGGAIVLGHNSSLGTGLVSMSFPTVLQASTTLTDVKNNFRLSGAGSGVGYVHTVSGSNSITITGTLEVAASNTLASNLSTGNTLTLGDVRLSTNTSSGTLTLSGSGNTTFAGVIRNGTSSTAIGSLTITNTGTTTLSGANTFTGNIVASGSGGRLVIGGAGQLSGTTGTYAGTITGTNVTFEYASSANSTLSGAISGTMPLLKTGVGTLTLRGTNTFAGGVTLAAGSLIVGSTSAFGTGTLTITGGSLDASASLTNQGNNAQNWNGDFAFVGSNPLDVGTGAVSLGGNRTVTVTSSTLTVAGIIDDGVNTFGLTKAGFGTLVLGGANTFHGGMTVSAGTLQLGSSSALPNSSAVTLGTGSTAGVLDFNTNTATLGSITFNGSGSQVSPGGKLNLLAGGTNNATITVTSGSHALHPDTTLQSNTVIDLAPGAYFSLHGDVDGSKSLTQIGSGTLAMYGANSYSGGTYLSGGYLSVLNTGALGSGTVTIAGNSILNLNNTILTNTVVFGSGSGAIINSGSLVNVTGTYAITSGTAASITTNYSVQSGGDISFVSNLAATVYVQGTAQGTFSADVLEAGTVIVNAGGRGVFSGGVSGNVTTSGSALFSGDVLGNVTVAGGTATFGGATGTSSAINVNSGLGVVTGTIGSIAHATATGATLEIRGRVLSTADVNAEAGATVKLMGSQAFEGTTLENDGSLIVDRTANLMLGALISGSGSLTKSDSLTLTLTANNTFSGLTTISGGTLSVGNGGASGALAGDVVNNAALIFNRYDDTTYAGNISGSGGLEKLGAGRLTLSGSSSYSGATTVSEGILAVNGQLASAVTVANGGTLGGSGVLGGAVIVAAGGVLAPGNSPGTLTMNSGLALDPASILNFELSATDFTVGAGVNDLIVVTGNFTLAGVLNVSAIGGGDFTGVPGGSSWRLFNYSGGTFTDGGLTLGSLPSLGDGRTFTIDTSTSGQVNLKVVAIVPEPSTLALACGGLAAAWALRRRQPRRKTRPC